MGFANQVNIKMQGSSTKMTHVRLNIYIYKLISLIFDCVTPDSSSLALLAHQLLAILRLFNGCRIQI